jgi:hypothetical protein
VVVEVLELQLGQTKWLELLEAQVLLYFDTHQA